jgi:hypothetical protein
MGGSLREQFAKQTGRGGEERSERSERREKVALLASFPPRKRGYGSINATDFGSTVAPLGFVPILVVMALVSTRDTVVTTQCCRSSCELLSASYWSKVCARKPLFASHIDRQRLLLDLQFASRWLLTGLPAAVGHTRLL